MGHDMRATLADIPAGHDNPLSYAITSRDRATLDMVRDAIAHKQVRLAYQPVVVARQQRLPAFYEGLLRVLDDSGRIIPAGQFIAAIETTETGRLMDCLALEFGLQTLAAQSQIRLSINMSARSIGYSRWINTLKRGLRRNPSVAKRLILEISEVSAMMMPELVIDFMDELQGQGIAFALDNFGRGFTSLRLLKDFYFNILKLDGHYTRDIRVDHDNQVLSRAILSIAHEFDMIAVAETVENPADAAFLTTLGFDCLQGFAFGSPSISPPWQKSQKPGSHSPSAA